MNIFIQNIRFLLVIQVTIFAGINYYFSNLFWEMRSSSKKIDLLGKNKNHGKIRQIGSLWRISIIFLEKI